MDPTIVRILFVVFAFMGPGILAYLILTLVVPRNPALAAAPTMRAVQGSPPPSSLDRY